MSTSPLPTDTGEARAQRVSLTEDALIVGLVDGRTITVPVIWYPRLAHTPEERVDWRLVGARREGGRDRLDPPASRRR
jgi:hypothetical protein